jgi:hypothetical protein
MAGRIEKVFRSKVIVASLIPGVDARRPDLDLYGSVTEAISVLVATPRSPNGIRGRRSATCGHSTTDRQRRPVGEPVGYRFS